MTQAGYYALEVRNSYKVRQEDMVKVVQAQEGHQQQKRQISLNLIESQILDLGQQRAPVPAGENGGGDQQDDGTKDQRDIGSVLSCQQRRDKGGDDEN